MTMVQSTDEECGIGLDALANPVALPCSHKFCSTCLDSWRSKYGGQGDPERTGRVRPLCREKITPTKEMLIQLKCMRKQKKKMDDTASQRYKGVKYAARYWWLGRSSCVGLTDEESLALPRAIFEAARDGDVQKVLDWLGPPPVDKRRVNARYAENMNTTLLEGAVLCRNSGYLSILLQLGADVNAVNAMGTTALFGGAAPEFYQQAKLLLEWGAEIDPLHCGFTTEEVLVDWGNVKLANLLMSELGGRRCELVNFSTRPKLNGKTCVAEKYLPDKDRYKIVFEGSEEKALVPPHNLKRRDRKATDCGYYITFEEGSFVRRDFSSKEECQTYVAEVEAAHATEQLSSLNIGSSKGRRGKSKKKGRKN